jgi:hypothetical protein
MYLFVGILYFGPFNPFHYSPLPINLPHLPPFFNNFQYTSLKPLPTQMLYFMILLMFYHSLFLSFFPHVPGSSFTIANMFYLWVSIWSCLFLCICLSFGSVFHLWEKTSGLCLSEFGLLHLIWCPPIASIYLQTTCHYSLWLSKDSAVYIYNNFLIETTWVVSKS